MVSEKMKAFIFVSPIIIMSFIMIFSGLLKNTTAFGLSASCLIFIVAGYNFLFFKYGLKWFGIVLIIFGIPFFTPLIDVFILKHPIEFDISSLLLGISFIVLGISLIIFQEKEYID